MVDRLRLRGRRGSAVLRPERDGGVVAHLLAQDLVVVGCPAGVRLLGCCGDGWCHVFDQVRCGDVFAARFELLCVPGQNCLGCDPGERCFARGRSTLL